MGCTQVPTSPHPPFEEHSVVSRRLYMRNGGLPERQQWAMCFGFVIKSGTAIHFPFGSVVSRCVYLGSCPPDPKNLSSRANCRHDEAILLSRAHHAHAAAIPDVHTHSNVLLQRFLLHFPVETGKQQATDRGTGTHYTSNSPTLCKGGSIRLQKCR